MYPVFCTSKLHDLSSVMSSSQCRLTPLKNCMNLFPRVLFPTLCLISLRNVQQCWEKCFRAVFGAAVLIPLIVFLSRQDWVKFIYKPKWYCALWDAAKQAITILRYWIEFCTSESKGGAALSFMQRHNLPIVSRAWLVFELIIWWSYRNDRCQDV